MESSEIIFRKNIIYLRMLNGISAYRVSKDTSINISYYYHLEDLSKPINNSTEFISNKIKILDYEFVG